MSQMARRSALSLFGSKAAAVGAAMTGIFPGNNSFGLTANENGVKPISENVVSILNYIPKNLWPGIYDGTNTSDLSDFINKAISEEVVAAIPPNAKMLCKKQIVIGRGKELVGYGRSSQILIDFTNTEDFPGMVGIAVYTNSLPLGDSVNQGYGRGLRNFSVYGVVNSALIGNATTGMRFYANRALSDGGYSANNRDQAVYFAYIGSVHDVHVRRFDVAFDLAEVWHTKFFACTAAESRIGIRMKGKNVDVQFIGCDITTMGTSYTSKAGITYGYYIENDVYGSRLNGWPEGIMIQGGMAVGGLTYSVYLGGSPFQVGLYSVTMDSRAANVYIAGTVQDLRVVGCNATIRTDTGACIEFASTRDSALSHATLISGNYFDCQAPNATSADGIRYPAVGEQRYAQTITDNRFRNAFRYCINGGGSAGNVGGFGYSTVTGNKSQQQTGGSLIELGYSGQYTLIDGNIQTAGVRVLGADNVAPTVVIRQNQSSVQLTGKSISRRQIIAVNVVDKTLNLIRIDYMSLYEQSTLVVADVTIRGVANYTRRFVYKVSYTSIFGGAASVVNIDPAYTFDQENTNYAMTFSPSVVVNNNQSFTLKLTIRSTGIVPIGSAEIEVNASIVTPKENINIS